MSGPPFTPTPPELDRTKFKDDPAAATRSFIAERRNWFEHAVSMGCDAVQINRISSDIIDSAVNALFERAASDSTMGCAVLGLGGYGRREMGLSSDIDLLFLIDDASEEQARIVTDGILYPFWDSGVEVGGATRTISDCISILSHDVKAQSAMIDARFICGSRELYQRFESSMRAHFSGVEARRRFALEKMVEHRKRLSRYGDSIYLLQPNIKEGEGGLREYHTFLWVARASHPEEDADSLIARYVNSPAARDGLWRSVGFIWAVRHALSLVDGSRSDRLGEALQLEVARRMGYASVDERSAAERFMTDYYRHAEELHLICERGIQKAYLELYPKRGLRIFPWRSPVKSQGPRLRDMEDVLRLFAKARKKGVALDPITKSEVTDFMRASDRAGLSGSSSGRLLREIFSDISNLDRTLMDMHECGLFDYFVPEMASLFHLVQHDGFHSYTVGVHSIRAVGELAKLPCREGRKFFPVPAKALSEIQRRHVLALAAFLHDIGKGKGGDHAEQGASMAREIVLKMGYESQDASDVEFLVRSHLLMSTLAFRRDVRDPALLERFAQSVRSPELLSMLYLVTFADIRAIGPRVWSDWKGALLAELYESTRERMKGSGLPHDRSDRWLARTVKRIERNLAKDGETESVNDFLMKMPERYVHSVSPETIAAHILLARQLDAAPLATLTRDLPERGCSEFAIVTKDSPGLFAKIAGVLSANGANIVDAQLYTASDGIAIDVLWVTDAVHRPFDDPERLSNMRKELVQVITGEKELRQVVSGRFKRRLLSWSGSVRPAVVTLDNDVSALHTVVEISADDRRGLLYAIASTIHDTGCTIDLARITTNVDRVIDVFYIREAGGGKLVSKERLEEVRARLTEAIEE